MKSGILKNKKIRAVLIIAVALAILVAVLSSAKRSMNYKCAAAALFEYYAAAMDYIGYISE